MNGVSSFHGLTPECREQRLTLGSLEHVTELVLSQLARENQPSNEGFALHLTSAEALASTG